MKAPEASPLVLKKKGTLFLFSAPHPSHSLFVLPFLGCAPPPPQYYTQLFRDDMGASPTDVELFDIAQSNSEHRHWFFNGNATPWTARGAPHAASASCATR